MFDSILSPTKIRKEKAICWALDRAQVFSAPLSKLSMQLAVVYPGLASRTYQFFPQLAQSLNLVAPCAQHHRQLLHEDVILAPPARNTSQSPAGV